MARTLFSPLAAIALGLLLVSCSNGEADDSQTGQPAAEAGADSAASAAAGNDAADMATLGETPGTGEMTLGDPDAPVTLVEYASVTCPACAAFHQINFPRLQEDYIDTGKVRLVFREFPTSPAQLSYLGSTLARCTVERSGNQEAYFAMLKTLFNNQQDWVSNNFQPELMSYAAQAGIGEQAFRDCASSDAIIEAINRNVRLGQNEDEVRGTPTFLVGGEHLEFSRGYDSFFVALDEKLVAAGVEPPAAPAEDEGMNDMDVVPQTQADPEVQEGGEE